MKIKRNILLLKLNNFFYWFWPITAVSAVYFQSITNNYILTALAFSVVALSQALLEIPIGIISDKWHRKSTMLVGGFSLLMAGIFFAFSGTFDNVLLLFVACVFKGMGDAFFSGTDDALMFETAKDMNVIHKYDIFYSDAKIYKHFGSFTAIIIAAPILYFFDTVVLAWVCLISEILHIIILTRMIEPASHIKENTTTIGHFISAFKKWIGNKNIFLVSTGFALNRAYDESLYRMTILYSGGILPLWLANIAVLILRIFGMLGFYLTTVFRKIGLEKIAFLSSVYKLCVLSIALIVNNYISPFVIYMSSLGHGGEWTSASVQLQQEYSASERATMQSLGQIIVAIFMSVGLYIVGLIADKTSVYNALIVLLGYKILVAVYFRYLMIRFKK